MPNTLSKENELQRKAFELYYGLGDKRFSSKRSGKDRK